MSATTTNNNNTLTIALTHAISFLTRPLIPYHAPLTIDSLHTSLDLLLTQLIRPTWPGPYTLSFSPSRLPHQAVWKASNAAGVRWSEWIALLGGFDFDLHIRPGRVSVKIGAWGGMGENVIWEEAGAKPRVMMDMDMDMDMRRLALLHPEDEDEIFDMIDQERAAGPGGMKWMTPIVDRFPKSSVYPPPQAPPPPALFSFHSHSSSSSLGISRPSSRSSSSSRSSNCTSLFSDIDSLSTTSSARSSLDLPVHAILPPPSKSQSQMEKQPRQRTRRHPHRPKVTPEVYIDATKKEVTNYDGGKTTVLTGGVMLGSRR